MTTPIRYAGQTVEPAGTLSTESVNYIFARMHLLGMHEQKDLARASGLHPSYLSMLLARRRNANLAVIRKLALALRDSEANVVAPPAVPISRPLEDDQQTRALLTRIAELEAALEAAAGRPQPAPRPVAGAPRRRRTGTSS